VDRAVAQRRGRRLRTGPTVVPHGPTVNKIPPYRQHHVKNCVFDVHCGPFLSLLFWMGFVAQNTPDETKTQTTSSEANNAIEIPGVLALGQGEESPQTNAANVEDRGTPNPPVSRWINKLHISRRAKRLSMLTGSRFERQVNDCLMVDAN
jgi:hypothetical protein